ncbi:MAG: ABC transporter permease [Acidobacteria bacterium]|nr:ABC transporter permease [Acidobacteriota bacterium]
MNRSLFNREALDSSLANILAHKFRSLLTILGIIIGIVTVVLVASVLVGVRSNIILLFQGLGTDNIFAYHLNRDPGNTRLQPEEMTLRPLQPEFAPALLSACPSLKDTAVQLYVPSIVGGRAQTARYRNIENENIQVQGATWNYAQVTSAEMRSGRVFSLKEEERRAKVCLLGSNIAESLFPSTDPIGKKVEMSGAIYTVLGVFEKHEGGGFTGENRRNNVFVIPLKTARLRYPEADTVILYCRAKPGMRDIALEEVESELRRLRGLKSGDESDFFLSTSDSIIQQIDQITALVRIGTFVISGLGLLVGGIGVMNIMLMSVTQRTREIGIRKAVGARKRDIVSQFLLEAAVLTTIGGLCGVTMAGFLGLILAYFIQGLPAVPPAWAVFSGLGVSTLVGLIFGVWPAVKAARLDPIESLRYE